MQHQPVALHTLRARPERRENRFFVLLTVSALFHGTPAHAQEMTRIHNLEAAHAVVTDDWLVYSVCESTADEDLNGDEDLEDAIVHVQSRTTGETRSLGLASEWFFVSGNWLEIRIREVEQSEDLNDDGDMLDSVALFYRLSTGEISGTAPHLARSGRISTNSDWYIYSLAEWKQEKDLNGDGDTADDVVHAYHLPSGEIENLGLVDAPFATRIGVGDWLVIALGEFRSGDLNGDGDTFDTTNRAYNLATGEIGLELQGYGGFECYGFFMPSEEWLVLDVAEAGQDLNADGDSEDHVFHVHNLSTGKTRNLKLASGMADWCEETESGDWIAFDVMESAQGSQDLNQDGDTDDAVLHAHKLSTGETRNLGRIGAHWLGSSAAPGDWIVLWDGSFTQVLNLATDEARFLPSANYYLVSGDWLVFTPSEALEGEDLNGDGDLGDLVYHVHRLSTGETTNLRIVLWGSSNPVLSAPYPLSSTASHPSLAQEWLVLHVEERRQGENGEDLNRDGDSDDRVAHLIELGQSPFRFLRGDCDGDGKVSLTDAVRDLRFCFGGLSINCAAACDTDGDGNPCTSVTDAVRLLRHLFSAGPPPPAPYPECGMAKGEVDCTTPPANCQ